MSYSNPDFKILYTSLRMNSPVSISNEMVAESTRERASELERREIAAESSGGGGGARVEQEAARDSPGEGHGEEWKWRTE